ncbi:hypothetical protein TBK1r_18410 [Stieleria magnilauensis]|uniref:Methyltransferase type 11 domain-containing protein n=2 Tax=Stieleria magnilauensis TaxID=2527963 RepID=A0ABX5XLY3_9BACT|nr:hypothetical protein TBK1r_18410 [Planctomycetes bacterium TBK1r]
MNSQPAMLHVAPEPCLRPHFKEHIGESYLTADLLANDVDVNMDITEIQYPDNTFDVIYCSHVLEHVPDDRKAMKEFLRVLNPDGFAVLMVPITAEQTVEDPSVTDPQERLRLFGQEDHVRRYGPDFSERLRGAGFVVDEMTPNRFCSEAEQRASRLPDEDRIYVCRRKH